MHAIVRPTRIDIEGSSGIGRETWEPLLDDLKAVHMPGLTPTGKRMMVAVGPTDRRFCLSNWNGGRRSDSRS
jgi:hypothetical protein